MEGKPTFFKETMQEYYVVTEVNGLIKDEHIKIEDKFHNNIQKVTSREDTNYKIY